VITERMTDIIEAMDCTPMSYYEQLPGMASNVNQGAYSQKRGVGVRDFNICTLGFMSSHFINGYQ
jgi:hypothetical protein